MDNKITYKEVKEICSGVPLHFEMDSTYGGNIIKL